MTRKSLKTSLLVAVAAIAAPMSVHAAGFQLKEQSVSGQGTSFAGVTAGGNGDASAMFYNPAAMGLVKGGQFVQTVTGVLPRSKLESASGTRSRALGGTNISGVASDSDIAQDAIVPSGYIVYSISDALKVGLSANGPWGLVTDYPENWVGRYHGIRSDLRTYNFTPTVSYQVNPMLTLGAGVQIQYAKAKLSSAIDAGAGVRRPGAFDAIGDAVGDDWGWGFTAGALVEPMKGTRIGLSYRSAVKHMLEGDLSFSTAPGTPGALAAQFQTQKITSKLVTPEVAGFGLVQDITPDWAVMADVQWTNWSRFGTLRINAANPAFSSTTEEHWHDTWFYALGTTYKVNDALTLRTGVAFDKGSVDTEFRTPRIPEQDRYWVSIGAGYKVTEALQIDAAYSHVFVPSADIALTDTGSRGNLTAKYKGSIDIIGVQARFSF
ncbi:OmpP1/FadL family transporter [Azospirillum sp. sgz301742]